LVRRRGGRLLLFMDELQRVADYDDGDAVLADLVDLYAGAADAVVLVDGSEERVLSDLLGRPGGIGKLVDRLVLASRIPAHAWRRPLSDRFAAAGLQIDDGRRDQLIEWARGRPYDTMAVCRYTALAARKTGAVVIGDFDVQMGKDEAGRRLQDDR